MDFQPRLGVVTRALQLAAPDLLHFFLVAGSVFLCYCVMGFLIFGNSLPWFSTLGGSINTCFEMLLGEFADVSTDLRALGGLQVGRGVVCGQAGDPVSVTDMHTYLTGLAGRQHLLSASCVTLPLAAHIWVGMHAHPPLHSHTRPHSPCRRPPTLSKHTQGAAGVLYFWSYMVLVFLILLNFLLAIIVDAFSVVKEATQERTGACVSVCLLQCIFVCLSVYF